MVSWAGVAVGKVVVMPVVGTAVRSGTTTAICPVRVNV